MNHEPVPFTNVDESKTGLTGRKALRPNHHLWDQHLRRWVLSPIRAPYEAGLKAYYGNPHYHGPGLAMYHRNVILAPNHRSWNDIPYTHFLARDVLGANFTIFPMKEELIRSFPWASFILPSLGGIFIDRSNPDAAALHQQNHRLARKYAVPTCIYPEATRVHTAKDRFKDADPMRIQKLKTGFVRFAAMTGYPILPVGIAGLAEYDQPDPSKGVHMYVGEPEYIEHLGLSVESEYTKNRIDSETERVGRLIQVCFDRARSRREDHTPPKGYPRPRRL